MSGTAELLVLLAQADDAERGMSWLETMQAGGVVGYLIIALSVVALSLIIMHLLQLRRTALMPPVHIEELDRLLAGGDVTGATEFCMSPENDSYITRILASGLTRYQRSAFGAFEIKNAIEEAGEDQTARLYRSTDALGVIGAIAPLLGLLGTVLGMVGAFESISRSAGSNYEELASNISLALVTTLMGLILAIPCIALFTFFRNRIDTFSSEASMEIERLTLYLESTSPGSAPAPAGARTATAPRPNPAPAPAPLPRPDPGPGAPAGSPGGAS
ncbi:MAG: MotA/TolQ/ExbB proton channel family protein [Planctomycetota bacterium]|jgi:biopolymer transport protein ExbB